MDSQSFSSSTGVFRNCFLELDGDLPEFHGSIRLKEFL